MTETQKLQKENQKLKNLIKRACEEFTSEFDETDICHSGQNLLAELRKTANVKINIENYKVVVGYADGNLEEETEVFSEDELSDFIDNNTRLVLINKDNEIIAQFENSDIYWERK